MRQASMSASRTQGGIREAATMSRRGSKSRCVQREAASTGSSLTSVARDVKVTAPPGVPAAPAERTGVGERVRAGETDMAKGEREREEDAKVEGRL